MTGYGHGPSLFEVHPSVMLLIDPELARVVDANAAAERFYGYTRAELRGMSIEQLDIGPRSEILRVRDELMSGRVASVERVHRLADGSLRDVRILSGALPPGFDPVRGIAIVEDITEELARRTREAGAGPLLEATLRALPLAVLVLDEQGIVQLWNGAAERLFGWSAAEVLGRPNPLFPAEHAAAYRADLARRRGGPTPGLLAVPAVRKDGQQLDVRISITGMDGAGRTDQVLVTVQEIDDVDAATRALHDAAAAYESLFHSLSEAVFIQDREGRFLDMNDAAVSMCGYRRAEMIGRTPHLFSVPGRNDPERVGKAIGRAFDGGVQQVLFWARRKDGRVMPLEVILTRATYWGSDVVIATARDVSERFEQERRLRESEQRYRLMVEGSEQVFFYSHDRDSVFQYLSPSVQAVLGYEARELRGRSYTPLLTGDPSDALLHERTAQMLAGELAFTTYTGKNRHRSGRIVTLEFTEAPIVRDGEIVGIQGFARDITARILLEEQLRQAQKMEAIGRLAGGVAHDFNNLLTAVHGHAELALAEIPDAPAFADARAELAELQAAAQRAADLTRQLLAFSRKQVLQPTVLRADEVVESVRRMLVRLIGENIMLSCDLDAGDAHVLVDRGQLEQALLNLVLNARDAMPRGGVLEIATAQVHLDEPAVSDSGTLAPGAYVQLRVGDSGEGIAAEVLPLIWEPFFTTKELGRGTGLGLSTVYGMVQQSGGSIAVSSEVGIGTTFTILLPRHAAPAAAPRPAAAPPRATTGAATVLLVEDEAAVRRLTQRILENAGFRVIEAGSGREGLERVAGQEDVIDAVVSDVIMPGMSGLELATRLRERRRALPVLLMSGYSDTSLQDPTRLDAPAAFLPKPFTGPDLLSKLSALLALRVG